MNVINAIIMKRFPFLIVAKIEPIQNDMDRRIAHTHNASSVWNKINIPASIINNVGTKMILAISQYTSFGVCPSWRLR